MCFPINSIHPCLEEFTFVGGAKVLAAACKCSALSQTCRMQSVIVIVQIDREA